MDFSSGKGVVRGRGRQLLGFTLVWNDHPLDVDEYAVAVADLPVPRVRHRQLNGGRRPLRRRRIFGHGGGSSGGQEAGGRCSSDGRWELGALEPDLVSACGEGSSGGQDTGG